MIPAKDLVPGDALLCWDEELALIIGITVNPSNSSKLRFFLFMPDGRIEIEVYSACEKLRGVRQKRDACVN